jgi:4-diphosphocytidyl-2-C-methyl-D-erythritol kinase
MATMNWFPSWCRWPFTIRLELKFIENPKFAWPARGFSAPANPDNLAWRAAQAFFSRIGWQTAFPSSSTSTFPWPPASAGAAATQPLHSWPERRFVQPASAEKLADLALKLGADVPFFLQQSPCIAHGIGEILEPLSKWPSLCYVIVMPDISVSTAWVYEALDPALCRPFKRGQIWN